jgi:hypothetical protein
VRFIGNSLASVVLVKIGPNAPAIPGVEIPDEALEGLIALSLTATK